MKRVWLSFGGLSSYWIQSQQALNRQLKYSSSASLPEVVHNQNSNMKFPRNKIDTTKDEVFNQIGGGKKKLQNSAGE